MPITKRASAALAQRNGAALERDLDRYHADLRREGTYVIRTGPPMRAVHRRSGVVWLPIPGAGGVPDYHANVGGMVAFDAKSSDGKSWGFDLLKQEQAGMLESLTHTGVSAIYLRLEGRDWWIPWHRLAERWYEWAAPRFTRAKPGTASLTTKDCAELGTEVHGCDWRRALTGVAVDPCPF